MHMCICVCVCVIFLSRYLIRKSKENEGSVNVSVPDQIQKDTSVKPRVLETLGGGRAPLRIEIQHRLEERGELLGVTPAPLVLLGEHVHQPPRLQAGDVPQLGLLVEEQTRVLALDGDPPRDLAQQLNDVGQVVFVAGVVLPGVRFKEVIAGGQLEGHTRGAPYVG